MRKAYIESTRRGVFGTTSVRTNAITKKDDTETPGPNHYQIKEKPFKSRYNQLSSTFASVTARLKDEPIVVKVGKEDEWTPPLMLCMHVLWTLLYTALVKLYSVLAICMINRLKDYGMLTLYLLVSPADNLCKQFGPRSGPTFCRA